MTDVGHQTSPQDLLGSPRTDFGAGRDADGASSRLTKSPKAQAAPRSEESNRTPLLVPRYANQGQPMKECPYCGRPIRTRERTCDWHDDLPPLDPLAPDVRITR